MKKQFTLVEIIIALVIVLILVTTGIIGYQKAMQNTRMMVSSANMMGLLAAVEVYVLENDSLPATLGQLLPEHLEKGYAYAYAETSWLTKLCFKLYELSERSLAWAKAQDNDFLDYENLKRYGATQNMFKVPVSSDNESYCYAINNNIAGRKWDEISDNCLIIAEALPGSEKKLTGSGDFATQYSTGILNLGSKFGLGVTKGKIIVFKMTQEDMAGYLPYDVDKDILDPFFCEPCSQKK